jgi:neutral ceramidase
MNCRQIPLLLGLVLMAPCVVALEAGTGVADITPDVQRYRVPMAGYGAREGKPSTGVHDPLRAKVLYLRDSDSAMAVITCDLRSMTPDLKDQVLLKVPGLGLTRENTLFAASHTHAGPSFYAERFWQRQFGVYDPAIVEHMSTAIAAALQQAVEHAVPARVGFGQTRAEGFTRNRRWNYDQEAREAAGESPAVDPQLSVIRVDTVDGAPVALLVHFATHPTILGHENMELTAEWPGVLQETLEQAFPGATVLYANGAEGDQAPDGAQGADGFAKIADFGARLALAAGDLARTIETAPELTIACSHVTPALPPFVFTEDARARYGEYLDVARQDLPRHAEIQVFRIGGLALAAIPGEPILEVGQAVQRAVQAEGFQQAIVIGLANDYIGYIVNEKEYAHGGYEVDSRSYYGPGLGAFIAKQAGQVASTISP